MKSTQAQAAKAIRQELKKAFPLTKFSVTSDSFAGGDSVRINWNNGVPTSKVEEIVSKYQYGHFDGLDDYYHHSNCRSDLPQSKYVQTSRTITEDVMEGLFAAARKHFPGLGVMETLDSSSRELISHYGVWTPREVMYRMARNMDFTRSVDYDQLIFEAVK